MVCLMVGGWSRQETKLQLQQPHSRGAGETGQMRPRRSSPGRSRSATTDDRQDHHSAMGLVRIPQLHISHFKSNSLKFTTSGIILVGCCFFSLFITVQPSVFKRAARKRREEVRGAEEVREDENTATELPVDQVSFTSPLGVFWTAAC